MKTIHNAKKKKKNKLTRRSNKLYYVAQYNLQYVWLLEYVYIFITWESEKKEQEV